MENTTSNFDNFGGNNGAMQFGQAVVAEVNNYTLLPAGQYPYKVTNVEKKQYEPKPTSKLPPCPMAEITLEVDGGKLGRTEIIHRLYWHSSTIWKVSELFISSGKAKKGETFNADPDQLIGTTGRCDVSQNTYTKNNGDEGIRNEIKACLEPTGNFGGF